MNSLLLPVAIAAILLQASTAAVINEEIEVARERRSVNYEDFEEAHLPATVWSCDFEAGEVCGGMQQVGNDNFDLTIAQQDPGSYAPSTAASGAHYAFIDNTVSPPRYPGDNAKLRITSLQTSGDHCLWFKAHMNGMGLDTARLRVYLLNGLSSQAPIYEKAGSLGTDWAQQSINIDLDQSSEIWFESVVGSSIYHSIALDDIRISEGKCPHHQWSCDFEGLDLRGCDGLYQSKDDDFDWTTISGPTDTGSSGPDAAFSGDRYVYTEASSPRLPGDKARLVIDWGLTLGNRCLSFAFNMFGRVDEIDTASLSVYKVIPGGDPELLWKAHGRHGREWFQARIDIQHSTYDQLYVEAVLGSGSSSDISIDNMFYDHGECPSTDYKCDFEEGRYCEDMQPSTLDSGNSNFDWQVINGTTPTANTGPDSAAQGFKYAYMEASAATHGHFSHLVIIHPFKPGPNCLQFKYHMYGHGHLTIDQSESKLSVRQSVGGVLSDDLWSMTDEQGMMWHQAMVTIDQQVGGQLIFEGTRGWTTLSDIGLDDIIYTSGACPVPPTPSPGVTDDFYCGFEEADTQCNQLINSTSANRDWYILWKNTPTGRTGPAGPYEGSWYTYLETSYGYIGIFSVLEINVNYAAGDRCLSFMYSMNGETMGVLLVYQTIDGLKLDSPEWYKNGNQSTPWHKASIDINHKAGHKIWIMARRNSGSSSDIALDNISYKNGVCVDEPAIPLPEPEVMWYCGFDESDVKECIGWEESVTDFSRYNWTISSVSSPTSRTGAFSPVSYPNFIYFESSPGRENHKLIGMVTQTFNAGDRCLEFYYHMFGSTMGTLNVYLAVDGVPGTAVWTLSGNQGFAWKKTSLTVSHAANSQLWFEAIKGTSSRSDISLDSITYKQGAC